MVWEFYPHCRGIDPKDYFEITLEPSKKYTEFQDDAFRAFTRLLGGSPNYAVRSCTGELGENGHTVRFETLALYVPKEDGGKPLVLVSHLLKLNGDGDVLTKLLTERIKEREVIALVLKEDPIAEGFEAQYNQVLSNPITGKTI